MSAVAEGQGGPAQEAAAGPAAGSDGYQRVASLEELQRAGRKRVRVGGEEGRAVVVFHVEGKLYALDYFCYHTGGPLDQGDIEEVGERLCVVCPWHRHSITMDTGESLYTSIDPLRPHTPHHIRSKGVKQRVHSVKVEGGSVLVRLSDARQPVESDRYFTEPYRQLVEGVLREPVLARPPLRLPLHSSRRGLH